MDFRFYQISFSQIVIVSLFFIFSLSSAEGLRFSNSSTENIDDDGNNNSQAVLEAVVKQLEKDRGEGNAMTVKSVQNKINKGLLASDIADLIKEATDSVKSMASLTNDHSEKLPIDSFSSQLAIIVDDAVAENKAERLARRQKSQQGTQSKQPIDVSFTDSEVRTAKLIMEEKSVTERGSDHSKSGWVYLGRFVKNDWLNKTLNLKKALPSVGRRYMVMQSLNIRSEPPTRSGASKLIKNLKKDDSLRILQVQQSGGNGHYWAEVEY